MATAVRPLLPLWCEPLLLPEELEIFKVETSTTMQNTVSFIPPALLLHQLKMMRTPAFTYVYVQILVWLLLSKFKSIPFSFNRVFLHCYFGLSTRSEYYFHLILLMFCCLWTNWKIVLFTHFCPEMYAQLHSHLFPITIIKIFWPYLTPLKWKSDILRALIENAVKLHIRHRTLAQNLRTLQFVCFFCVI